MGTPMTDENRQSPAETVSHKTYGRSESREQCSACAGTGKTNRAAKAGSPDRVRKQYFAHCGECMGLGYHVIVGKLMPIEQLNTLQRPEGGQ
ncbi:hypothetical protein [Bradyrhizobium sp. JYMT SZCCT0428]|uniref:hypothetical protein n=1 Tax=Bradyrhizobium sp. JYMT SZCCT0428 TaxID=2807673 RepID=UPI001BA966AD|nr:hypothetical protein [Bradyrhizobium sp. JYMT SZCCT0428]MBR1150115.1 hypothetical protein [Bradyrhizobium sp. JYMT SZCCT0428]